MAEIAKTVSSCRAPEHSCGPSTSQHRSILWLQIATISWMVLECVVSLSSARTARSPSLLAFGADSFVELVSAAVVLLQFIPAVRLNSLLASKSAGILLYTLAGVVVLVSVLGWTTGARPEASLTGIFITAAALVIMPALAWSKRRLAKESGNIALAADAVQSATCAYLAAITLVGLAANEFLHIQWLDSAAAIVAVPLLAKEAKATMRGEGCDCC